MDLISKLRLFITLAYGGKQNILAEDLGITPPSVSAWMRGGDIRSTQLARLLEIGLSVNWLLDPKNTDPRQMFANNAAGRELARKHFGIAYLSVEETMKPWEGKGADRAAGEPGEVAPKLSLERSEKPKKPGSKGPKKNHGPKEKAK